AGQYGDEEQAERRDDQQRREQNEILRPEGRAEDVELLLAEVPQHRLATVPVQPDCTEVEQHQQAAAQQAQVTEIAAETAGVNRPAALRGREADRLARVDYFDELCGDAVVHLALASWAVR